MDYTLITLQETHEGQVVHVTLNPPPANIVSSAMMEELSHFLKAQNDVANRKAIVFSGAGKHFSFGASVEEHAPDRVGDMLPKFHRFIGELIACEVPTFAKVTGCCLGGGFEMALACTYIFADQAAKFAVPEIKLGVFPPPASVLLPWRGGDAFASEMIISGEMYPAAVCLQRNLINAVSEEGQLGADIHSFIEKALLPKSAASLRYATTAARLTTVAHYNDFISKLEKHYLEGIMSTNDAVEGIMSFLEKREPVWTNA